VSPIRPPSITSTKTSTRTRIIPVVGT
jgi:hypothetical protein